MPTFVHRVESNGLFDKAIEDRQLTDCLMIQLVFNCFNFTSYELDILWMCAELQENKMKSLSFDLAFFKFAEFGSTYGPGLMGSSKPDSKERLGQSQWGPVARILRGLKHIVEKRGL